MQFLFKVNVNVMLCLANVDAKYRRGAVFLGISLVPACHVMLLRQCHVMSSYVNGYLILVVQSMDESLALVLPTLELSSRKLDCLPRVLLE